MSKSVQGVSRATIAVAIAGTTLIAAALWYWKNGNERPQLERLPIAQTGDFFLYAPLYIAKDAGFFKDVGLDVHIVSTGGDEKTWAAVISGSASIGVADPTFIAIAGQRGQPGKVIANVVNGVPFWGVAKDPKVGVIESPSGLRDLTVGTFPSPSTAYTLQKKMFLDGGLVPRIKEGAFGTILAMLDARVVDIALELEPNVSQAVKAGARVVYGMPEIYGDFAITGLTVTPKYLSERPEQARAVVCALQKAVDYTRKRPAESLEILRRRFPEIGPEIAKSAFERVIKANIIPISVVTSEGAWKRAIDLRVEAHACSAHRPTPTLLR